MAIDIDIPTILCLIISNKEKPATYVSSGTHIDPELAVDAALKEAIVAHNIYRTNNAVGKLYNNKFEVEGLSDHFNYYSHPSKITTYDWLIETSKKKNLYEVYPKIEKNFSDVEAVEFVIKKMENIKEIYSVLLENRFIQNKGLYVVKVVIPEMQTMYFGYKNKRININRLDAAINNSKHRYKVEFNRENTMMNHIPSLKKDFIEDSVINRYVTGEKEWKSSRYIENISRVCNEKVRTTTEFEFF